MARSNRTLAIAFAAAAALIANAAWFGRSREPEGAITPEPPPSATARPSAVAPVAPSPSLLLSSLPSAVRPPTTLSPCRTPDKEPFTIALPTVRASAIAVDRAGNTFVAAHARPPDKVLLLAYGLGGGLLFRTEVSEGTAAGVALDKNGEALVIGTLPSEPDKGSKERAFLARIGPGGGVRKRITIGEPGDEGRAVAVDSEGNIVALVGSSKETRLLTFDPSFGERWRKAPLGPPDKVRAGSLAVGSDDGILVGGSYKGPADLGGGPLPSPKYGSRGFVLALDKTGNHRFSKPVGGPSDMDARALVATGRDGRIAAAVAEDGQSDGVMGYVQVTVIASFDASGAQQFEHRLLHDSRPSGLTFDATGTLNVTGHYAGALELSGRVRLPPAGDKGGGFVIAFDPSGALRFTARAAASDPIVATMPWGEVVLSADHYANLDDQRVTSFCPPSDPPGPGDKPQARVHAVRKRYALPHGEGYVELLLDARLKAGAEKGFGCFFWAGGAGPDFDSPPLGAALRLVDGEGKVLDQLNDDHPMGTAEPIHLYGDDRVTFPFTVNDSPCMGKRRGLVTTYVEVAAGKLHQLRDQHGSLIAFTASMTGAARLVPARSGLGKDILKVRSLDASGPESKDGYVTLLVRYSFTNGRWVSHEKRVPGEWLIGEGGELPARGDFP